MSFESIYKKPHEPLEKRTLESLSPEVHKIVMDKVRYINEDGTMFTWLDGDMNEVLPSVLENGLLGRADSRRSAYEEKDAKEEWYHDFRNKRMAHVHFNIVDRMHRQFTDIRSTVWSDVHGPLDVCILFKIDSSREYPQPDGREDGYDTSTEEGRVMMQNDEYARAVHNYELKTSGHKGYPGEPAHPSRPNKFHPSFVDGNTHRIGSWEVDDEYGFILNGRVPPRAFHGLALQINSGEWERDRTFTQEEANGWKYKGRTFGATPEEIDDAVNYVASVMIEKNKKHPERMVPIYDREGNLLWPEKMSVNEIKKMRSKV